MNAKEVAELENELQKAANAKAKLEAENKGLHIKVLEMEEQLAEARKLQEQIKSETGQQKDEVGKLLSKNAVVETYASDLQRKMDMLTLELREKTQELEQLKTTDWTKRLLECNAQIEALRTQLLEQEKNYGDLKAQLTAAAQMSGGNKKHFETFVEEQSKELLKARKIVCVGVKVDIGV